MTPDLVVRSDLPREEGPPISLHLLVRNGESVVGRLLDCVGPYLAEAVVVLERCEDDTEGVLVTKSCQHGFHCEMISVSPATHPELYLRDVPETYRVGEPLAGEELPGPHTGGLVLADFAAARNLGWSRCRGEWRLFLDADDVVDDPACLPGLCAALSARGVDAAASRYLVGAGRGGVRERLCRNRPEIRWEGPCHERLVGLDPSRVASVEGSLVVRDLRDSLGEGTRPPNRNLKILYRRARAVGWDAMSSRDLAYLAVEAREVLPDLARRAAMACVVKSAWPEERAWAAMISGQTREDAGDFEKASFDYVLAYRTYPSRETCLRLARTYFHLQRWELSARAWEEAGRLRHVLPSLELEPVDEVAVSALVAAALHELGRGAEALALVREAWAARPGLPGLASLAAAIEGRAAVLPPSENPRKF